MAVALRWVGIGDGCAGGDRGETGRMRGVATDSNSRAVRRDGSSRSGGGDDGGGEQRWWCTYCCCWREAATATERVQHVVVGGVR